MQRKITIHKSLYKPALFVGCERLPFTLITTTGGVILMAYQNSIVFVSVLFFYLFSIIFIRRVNENDPQFFKCMLRYLWLYSDYYPSSEFYPGRVDKPLTQFE